ncbi:MAG TPA: hypothetical protein VH815_05870, partial [Acidobacteriota bacterium]
MRKQEWIVAMFVIFVLSVLSFFSGESSDDLKVWIFFKDRGYVKFNGANAIQQVHFSKKAIERRQVRGLQSWSETDQAVDPAYISQVKAAGAQVFVVSRWLNAVSAKCNSNCRAKLAKLNFVSEIRPVATYIQSRVVEKREVSISRNVHFAKATSDEFDYGPSRQQLDEINVIDAHRKGFAGQGETVAIFADGFLRDHIAFKDHDILEERNFVTGEHGKGSCGGSSVTVGTATWSIFGGETPGKLYGPSFKSKVILAATDLIGDEPRTEEDNWVAAFEWADQ